MASTANVILCGAVALLVWTCIGAAIARHVIPARTLVWPLAPLLGWAVHSAAALPLFMLLGLTWATVALVMLGSLAASCGVLWRSRHELRQPTHVRVPAWAWIGAALVALAPAVAILPKAAAEGVILSSPIFDHAKVAMIDEMARLGVPPGNPFLGETGQSPRLAYYYLWHFSAAELAALLGVTGWEADAAMTWFAAFASLMLMIGLATWFGNRALPGALVLLFSVTGSLRLPLREIPGSDSVVRWATGFAGWLFQSAWVPQHIASASCVVLAIYLLCQLGSGGAALLATFVLVVVAGFQSSTWVGGATFAAAAALSGTWLILAVPPAERRAFALRCTAAAACALALASPFLYDQQLAAAARGSGLPIRLMPYEVLGHLFPDPLRGLLDLPAYWLVLLVIEFPAVYLTGAISLISLLRSRALQGERRRLVIGLAGLAMASLLISWLLVSTLADNNDLGWRAILPGAMVLTIFAAVGLTHWIASRARFACAAALIAAALALPGGISWIRDYLVGVPSAAARDFAATPAMWAAVRAHAGTDDRVGNNPLFMREMTLWPVNISWALLANRRSCYAGHELALPYVPLAREHLRAIDAQFIRVFAGEGDARDLAELVERYHCRIIVVTPRDGAWHRDAFAASPRYRLLESNERWRIYLAGD